MAEIAGVDIAGVDRDGVKFRELAAPPIMY